MCHKRPFLAYRIKWGFYIKWASVLHFLCYNNLMIYITALAIILVSTLFHFLYEITHHNKFVALFAAVNESVWEHIKIGLTPTIIWCIIAGFIYGWTPNLLMASALCLSCYIILIPLYFYGYTTFTKKAILPVDIICFCLIVLFAQFVFFHFLNLGVAPLFCVIMSVVLLVAELITYFAFTFFPPKNHFFKDPISKKYGLAGHTDLPDHHHKHGKKKSA